MTEKETAKRLLALGYRFSIQFVTADGANFGEPLCFKTADAVGPFMRESGLKQKWVKKLDEVAHG
jgi:hypothetical protein